MKCMHRCQTKRCVAECCILKWCSTQQNHQSVYARNKKQLHIGNDLTNKTPDRVTVYRRTTKNDATESFVDAFNLHAVPACVMPKIKHPSTMPENLQRRISAPNVNSSHHSWSQELQESYIRFACLSTLMEAFFVLLFLTGRVHWTSTPKIQKSKIQKEKHSEGVHKALAAMRHTKPEPDKIGVDMQVCAHLSNRWVM